MTQPGINCRVSIAASRENEVLRRPYIFEKQT